MTNDTHRIVGGATAVGACAVASVPLLAAGIVVAAAWWASPGPDRLEHPLPVSLKTERRLERLLRVRLHFRHRGWTHWLVVGALVAAFIVAMIALIAAGLGVAVEHASKEASIDLPDTGISRDDLLVIELAAGVGAMVGYMMHSIADAMTKSGSLLFSPLYRKPIHLLPRWLRITTGGAGEHVVQMVCVAVVVWVAYQQLSGVS